MKPLNLKETALKEEMKERCLTKGQYIDENAKAKFEMLCHLEDFEVQYWELQQENKQLKEENQKLKSQLAGTTFCYDEEEHRKLQENYDRIYDENCKLREEHNINDISLLDENYRLKKGIDKAIEYIRIYRSYQKIDNKDYLKGRDEIGCLDIYQVDELLDILKEK